MQRITIKNRIVAIDTQSVVYSFSCKTSGSVILLKFYPLTLIFNTILIDLGSHNSTPKAVFSGASSHHNVSTQQTNLSSEGD